MSTKQILSFIVVAVVVLLSIIFMVLKIGEQSMTIEQVKEKHESELIAIDGVVGVGIGRCEVNECNSCIKVYLVNDSADLKKQIPAQLDGFKVDTEVTGPIVALPK